MAKNTICLWYDKDAEAAVHRAPSDYPSDAMMGMKKIDIAAIKAARRG